MPGIQRRATTLTEAQKRDFFEVGWVLLPDQFDADEIAEMRAAFDRLRGTAERLGRTATYEGSSFVIDSGRDDEESIRIQRVVWCGAAESTLADYGRDPRLLQPAAQILESREMNQLINQAHFKLPGDGVRFPWHQDSTHRRYGGREWRDINGRGSYVQTVTAIDDVTEENGPLRFVRHSARSGHVALPPEANAELPAHLIDPEKIATPTMRAGSVLMFGPYVFHSSEPNRSSRPRRVFINGYAYPGANSRVYPGTGSGRLLRI